MGVFRTCSSEGSHEAQRAAESRVAGPESRLRNPYERSGTLWSPSGLVGPRRGALGLVGIRWGSLGPVALHLAREPGRVGSRSRPKHGPNTPPTTKGLAPALAKPLD